MKKIIAFALVTCLLLALLAGCDNGQITAEKAQKIVLKDLGVSASDVTMHTHVTTYEGEACFSIYVTVDGETLEYVISGTSGEILAVNESEHSH